MRLPVRGSHTRASQKGNGQISIFAVHCSVTESLDSPSTILQRAGFGEKKRMGYERPRIVQIAPLGVKINFLEQK
ncbi:hypothetical protein Poly41_18300 [Novipirellula artificiosorum]|uniref:Uncharacterized protein n=1 Tax=Novipirellula artificiosorum TaxID=2528016 RepID=A0A5C6DX74_9BACT|nr:hypothetical protein Poly41_18300 [Novipirellula artificiosorum]